MLHKLRQLFLLNELGGNEKLIVEFSDPDGVNTGKSGWSFGLCQFDLSNNGMATLCLLECNFSNMEIKALRDQTCFDMKAANKRLAAYSDVVAKWDERQLLDCIVRVQEMAKAGGWSYFDERSLLYAADYHNQMYLSKGGPFFVWAKNKKIISDYDIYKFRINQEWGKKRPDDVKRRYHNLLKIYHEEV